MTYYVTVFIFNLSKEHEIASYSKSMLMCSKINPFISGIITLSMILTVSLKSFASYDFKTSNGSVNGEMLSIFCNMVTGFLVNVPCLQGSECYLFQCAVSILSTWVRLFAFGIVLDFSLLLASLSFFSCLFVAIVACAMVSFPLRVIFTIRCYCCFCSILLSVLAMFLMTVYCDCCFDAKSTLL